MSHIEDLARRRNRAFGSGAQLFYEQPIELVRGEGVWLFDDEGNRYLDLYNNVPCVGHANQAVVDAVERQMATLNVHSRYLHDGAIAYAERVTGLHHDGIESIVMACSGTEANEVALMMVRTATGRRGIVCTDAAYHGNSAEVAAMTRLPAGEQRDAVRSIPTPDLFRPPEPGLSADDLCRLSIRHLEEAIERLEADGHGFAAFVLCPILANEGLPQAPPGFFEQMMATVHAAGGLVVADEVQAGFGRTGEWWGYERSGFMPDVVTMGKPMGNGVPVSGAAASHDVVSAFRAGHRYFNTFAASPLQAAAGNAVLDEIERRGLVAQSRRVGEEMLAGLRALQAHDPRMGDVRGHGLFVGVDWVVPGTTDPDERGAAAMVEALKRRGMLMGRAGRHANLLKIRPPLVFDSDHAQSFLAGFADALGDAPH